MNNSPTTDLSPTYADIFSINENENVLKEETTENKNITNMNDEDANKIIIVNLSNDDDDNIPTPTITTSKAYFEDDVEKHETAADLLSPETPSDVDVNINDNLNEFSTESFDENEINTERTLEKEASKEVIERVIYQEPFDIDEEDSVGLTDSSLSDIDLDQIVSERLNSDFSEVDLDTNLKDEPSSPEYNGIMDACAANLIDDNARPVLLEQIIGSVDKKEISPIIVGNTTADIINSSLMKLNSSDENTINESDVEKIRSSFDTQVTDSESNGENDDDSINIRIIISSPENEETELFNNNNVKIVVTDPDNVKQTIYPYVESGFKEAINKAIDKRKFRSNPKQKKTKNGKSKKTVRFNIENDPYNSDNEVINLVDENDVESLKKEVDRLNSRVVEEIKARTIIQHTLDDTIIESEKVKKEAIEKSDSKIRETMEYVHRLQESMDNRINKIQNDNLEKIKELQETHDAQLEEERGVWRQIEQDARQRLQNEREEKNRALEENKRLEKVIEQLKAQIEEDATNSENFQMSVKSMLEEYENKFKEEQQERKNAEEVINRVLEKSRDYQDNVEDLKILNKTLKESNQDLTEKLSSTQSKLEVRDRLVEELTSKIGSLDFTIQILKEDQKNSVQKIKLLSSETQTITDRSIQQINEVKEENDTIYKLLDNTTKKYNELQALYNVKEEEVENLKKKMEQLTKKFKRILRKNIMKSGLESSFSPVPTSASFEILSNNSSSKETPLLIEPPNIIIEEGEENNLIQRHDKKRASNASITSTSLSISSLVMPPQNDNNNGATILPYYMGGAIKEEDEGEIIPIEEEGKENNNDNNNNNENPVASSNTLNVNDDSPKNLELPKLVIPNSNEGIIETILSAQISDGDSEDDDTDDIDYKGMNNNELSNLIEKRTMEFRTDDAEYLDFVEKLKVPSKISNAKFVKRCEAEEINGCLTFEGEYAGFFNNRKLFNNAKNGTILIEPMTKKPFSPNEPNNVDDDELYQQPDNLKCALCSHHSTNPQDKYQWFKFKASINDSNYEQICPYCRERLANVCEWYSYLRLIQNNLIKKNPKYIYSELLDIKRRLFYSKNGITFKYQN